MFHLLQLLTTTMIATTLRRRFVVSGFSTTPSVLPGRHRYVSQPRGAVGSACSAAAAVVAHMTTRPEVVPRAVSDELLQKYNSQVTNEFGASQLYLAASIWCDQRDLVGMAAYMRVRDYSTTVHF